MWVYREWNMLTGIGTKGSAFSQLDTAGRGSRRLTTSPWTSTITFWRMTNTTTRPTIIRFLYGIRWNLWRKGLMSIGNQVRSTPGVHFHARTPPRKAKFTSGCLHDFQKPLLTLTLAVTHASKFPIQLQKSKVGPNVWKEAAETTFQNSYSFKYHSAQHGFPHLYSLDSIQSKFMIQHSLLNSFRGKGRIREMLSRLTIKMEYTWDLSQGRLMWKQE